MELKPYLIDTPILMVFFARPDCFERVFNKVREARPSRLYLCQDGPRKNRPDDVENIMKCRRIAENIDWNCEVYTRYSDFNLGCDMNIYIGISWIFEREDKMIMLEDDAVPDKSFFKFCSQMLQKYEEDERINLISSLNLTEKWYTPASYFFAKTDTMSGCWGTWKRVWDQRDESFSYLHDYDILKKLRISMPAYSYNQFIQMSQKNLESFEKFKKYQYFEVFLMQAKVLQNKLNIVPAANMQRNIGMTKDAVHGTSNMKHLPRKLRKIFDMDTYEMDEPIRHPNSFEADELYFKKVNSILGYGVLKSYLRKVESKIRRIIYKEN